MGSSCERTRSSAVPKTGTRSMRWHAQWNASTTPSRSPKDGHALGSGRHDGG
jgi:hypothetical protein